MQRDQELLTQDGPGCRRVDCNEVSYVTGICKGLFTPPLIARPVVLVLSEQPVVKTPFTAKELASLQIGNRLGCAVPLVVERHPPHHTKRVGAVDVSALGPVRVGGPAIR